MELSQISILLYSFVNESTLQNVALCECDIMHHFVELPFPVLLEANGDEDGLLS